ncbi:helix-turn-helix transcriptional regulator [Actinoplanes flavus]|uniref:DNA-binding protein n=1 Tax=Actinoplanes flavus TaxID=2820290 RepID=A0ABS3V009_9ACTN|nr:AlpA family phage regulatory protein [Actinoplanes flavus]MBO3744165.1 DNA-binding protein [Actinoplanes flavus]
MTSRSLRLMDAHEIRVRLGNLSPQRVYQITNKASFPKPVAVLGAGKIWLADDVEAWIAEHRPSQRLPTD